MPWHTVQILTWFGEDISPVPVGSVLDADFRFAFHHIINRKDRFDRFGVHHPVGVVTVEVTNKIPFKWHFGTFWSTALLVNVSWNWKMSYHFIGFLCRTRTPILLPDWWLLTPETVEAQSRTADWLCVTSCVHSSDTKRARKFKIHTTKINTIYWSQKHCCTRTLVGYYQFKIPSWSNVFCNPAMTPSGERMRERIRGLSQFYVPYQGTKLVPKEVVKKGLAGASFTYWLIVMSAFYFSFLRRNVYYTRYTSRASIMTMEGMTFWIDTNDSNKFFFSFQEIQIVLYTGQRWIFILATLCESHS